MGIFSSSLGDREYYNKFPRREQPTEILCGTLTPREKVFSAPQDIVKNNDPKTKNVLPPPPPPPAAPT